MQSCLKALQVMRRNPMAAVHLVFRLGPKFWFLAPSILQLFPLQMPTFNPCLVSMQTNPDLVSALKITGKKLSTPFGYVADPSASRNLAPILDLSSFPDAQSVSKEK